MRKLALVIKSVVISLCCMNCAWADDIDTGDYSLRFLAINIPKKNISFYCLKSNPKEDVVFYEIFVDDNQHLYNFYSRAPLLMTDCLALVRESKNLIKRAEYVALLGQNKMPGVQIKQKDWNNDLLKKYQGKVNAMSFFSQISNGKSCKCWFEGCACLPTKDEIKVDILRNYQE